MNSKIIKETNRLGKEYFISLVRYKFLGFIPVWLSVCYDSRRMIVLKVPYFFVSIKIETFALAEHSIEFYYKQKKGKIVKKEVRRRSSKPSVSEPAPAAPGKQRNKNDLLVKMTFPELKEFTGHNVRKPTHDEVICILKELSIRVFSQTKDEQFEDFQADYINEMYNEVKESSTVYELSEFNKRLFCFSQIQLLLVDDDDVQHLTGRKVNKGQHHHADIVINYFSIASNYEVTPVFGFIHNMCLHKTS